MNEDDFKKTDEEMKDLTKSLGAPKIPDSVLRGFSASVEKRILGKKFAKTSAGVPAWAWVPALLLIGAAFFALVILRPTSRNVSSPSPSMSSPHALSGNPAKTRRLDPR